MAIYRLEFFPPIVIKHPEALSSPTRTIQMRSAIDTAILRSETQEYELGTHDVTHPFERMRGMESSLTVYRDGRGTILRCRDVHGKRSQEKNILQKDSRLSYQVTDQNVVTAVNYWLPDGPHRLPNFIITNIFFTPKKVSLLPEEVVIREALLNGFLDSATVQAYLDDLVRRKVLQLENLSGRTFYKLLK